MASMRDGRGRPGFHLGALLRLLFGRLVRPGFRPRRDGEPIPGIDGCHRQCQIGKFFVGKMFSHILIHLTAHMPVPYIGYRLGPRQRSPFAIAVIRRLLPCVQAIKPLLVFASGPQIFPVHVDAVVASVDLRSPQFDKIKQRRFRPALMKIFLQPQYGFVSSRRHFQIRNSTFHKSSRFSRILISMNFKPVVIRSGEIGLLRCSL
jgi:hypothetical protein